MIAQYSGDTVLGGGGAVLGLGGRSWLFLLYILYSTNIIRYFGDYLAS